jgi:hypothetical protein
MAPDLPRRRDADHLGQEGGVLIDQRLGHDAGAQDLAAVIDVLQEGVERAGALDDAALERAPFLGAEDPRAMSKGISRSGSPPSP